MKKRIVFVVGMLLVLGVISFGWAVSAADCRGNWLGTIRVPGAELRVVIRITADGSGALTAKMDSPDQGAKDIPVDKVLCDGTSVQLTATRIQGSFEGTLQADGSTLSGTWRQGGMNIPLELKRVSQAPETKRPQTPQKPYPYTEEEVVFENPAAVGVRLAGTLTLPKNRDLPPVVMLISGSGPQDRNETIFNHQPFLVLADYLTRNGIAVLRYDDRGIGKSSGDFNKATTEDFAGDVLAGVAYLKTRKEIDARKIGLIGHSEGAIIAPLVAQRSEDIRFLVLLAGMGLTGEEILLRQGALIARASGAGEAEIAKNQALQKGLFSVVKEEKDPSIAEKRLKEVFLAADQEKRKEEEKKGMSEAFIAAQIKSVNSNWFRYFLTFDPRPVLQKIHCPVLALNGEKDLQVPAEENLAAIRASLQAGATRIFGPRNCPG